MSLIEAKAVNIGTLNDQSIKPVESPLIVYYDGACPLCSREINFYRRRRGADAIDWVDVSNGSDVMIAPDLMRAEALGRFHVRLSDGKLESGARGFGELWAALPGFRWLGLLARSRAIHPLLETAYRGFLKLRPAVQSSLARRCEKFTADPYPRWLERELRSDHAGETGAVAIYRGVLMVSRCSKLRTFAHHHLETESRHLDLMNELVPRRKRSKLLPLWHLAGFVTGALPAIFGSRSVYATIEAVETFVDGHYEQQIERLRGDSDWLALRETLVACRADEVAHRDEARRCGNGHHGWLLRLWLRAVAVGSASGVALARRL